MISLIHKYIFVIFLSLASVHAQDIFHFNQLNKGLLSVEMVQSFKDNGYLIIKGFFRKEKISKVLDEYKGIVRSFPTQGVGKHFFETGENQSKVCDAYFIESADYIRPFFNSLAQKTALPVDFKLRSCFICLYESYE